MKEFFIELGLLLGLESLKKRFNFQLEDQDNIDQFLSIKCKFFRNLRKIIRDLIETLSLQNLSVSFQLSTYFLILITKKSKSSGLCLACDKNSDNLENHFKSSHKLTRGYFLNYKQIFGPLAESFDPVLFILEDQKPKILVDYTRNSEIIINKISKSEKGHSLEKLNKTRNLNILDKKLPTKGKRKKNLPSQLTDGSLMIINSIHNEPGNKVPNTEDTDIQEIYSKIEKKKESKKKPRELVRIDVECPICHKKLMHHYLNQHMMRHYYKINPENKDDYSSLMSTLDKLENSVKNESIMYNVERNKDGTEKHDVILVSKIGRCVYCKILKLFSNATYKCVSCNVYLHCITKDCFYKYHALLDN